MLLEALAAGCWSLAANCGGSSEVLSSPEFGQLLPPIQLASSKEPWLKALHEALLHSPPRELSLASRHQLVDRFSIQRSAQRWEALLEELID
jgi:glycosyltransferase involved in cell wall biosynthesis